MHTLCESQLANKKKNASMWVWIVHCLKNYAVFKGRASWPEYWSFYLVTTVGNITVALVPQTSLLPNLLILLWYVSVFVPSLAVTARRLHDIGRSFWWVGALVLVGVGSVVRAHDPRSVIRPFGLAGMGLGFTMFVFTVLPGDPGPNRYCDPAPATPG